MKRKVVGMISLLLALMLLFTGCKGQKAAKKLLPNYEKASSVIGLTIEEVLEKTGWQKEDVASEEDILYYFPLGGEIDGVHFETESLLDSNFSKVMGVTYRAQLPEDAESAAESVWKVISAVNKTIGKDAILVNSEFMEITKKDLQERMEKKRFRDEWVTIDLSELIKQNHIDYINETKNTDFWKNNYPELDMIYALQIHVYRSEGVNYIELNLGPTADPNGHKTLPPDGAQYPEDVD